MDVDAFKERQAQVWGMGQYAVLARRFEPAAVALRDGCAVSAGQEVLDVGAGDGNFALACAHEGASVVASDLSPGMVERGRARTTAAGYEIEWVEADVEALPFEDGRFDCAGSVFGAFLAPRPDVAARELFRVVRPGGTVGLTAWTRDGLFAEIFEIGRRYVPPPEGMPRPDDWGEETTARSRLEGLASHVEFERHTIALTAESPQDFEAELTDNAPTYAAARSTLSDEQFERFRGETLELARRWNRAEDGTLRIDAGYLVIVARKRG